MADTITFIQGSSTLDLDDGTAYEVKTINLSTPAPDALMHMPDYGENRVVRTEDKDREATLRMRIRGDDWNDIHNNIAEIRRWLKEASRAEVDGDTDTVYLQLKRGTTGSTATHATNNRIRYGWLDGDSSIWTQWGEKSEQAIVVFLHLILTPYGDRATSIDVLNYMFSSPHFVEDTTDPGGLADGWNLVNVPTTDEISTSRWLIGGQSQKIVTQAANTEGIRCDTVTCDADNEIVAYAWIQGPVGDSIRVILTDGAAGVAESKTLQPNDAGDVADKTIFPGPNGFTWYRVSVSDDGAPARAAADAELYIYRHTADASQATTFYVDACYLEVGSTTAPDAWMSARHIDCRNDIQGGAQATENYLNYYDVGLIPGDAPALVTHKIQVKDASLKTYIMGRVVDGDTLASAQPHWIEIEDAGHLKYFTDIQTTGTGDKGVWSDPGDAAASNGTYVRYTEDDDETGGGIYKMLSGADVLLRDFFKTPHRIYLAYRTTAVAPTAVTFNLDIIVNTSNPVTLMAGNTLSPAAANTWYLGDCGYFNPDGVLPPDVPDPTIHPNSVGFFITVDGLAFDETADIDFIFAPWVGGDFTVFEARNPPTADKTLWLVGKDKALINEIDALYESGVLGSMWTLDPGLVSNRIAIMAVRASGSVDITDAFTMILEITPRTRHLMGTF